MKNSKDNLQIVLLKSTNNEYELSISTSLLEGNNIPYILKERESGGYMRIIGSSSPYSTDILVEESMYEKAREILNSVFNDINNEKKEGQDESE